MSTRVVHVVRCKDPANPDRWIDVKVVLKRGYIGPDTHVHNALLQIENLLDCSVENARPYAKDDTGAELGYGNKRSCTRVSHWTLMQNPADPTQCFYAECLDKLAFKPPLVPPKRHSPGDYPILSDPEMECDPELMLDFPQSDSTARVIDRTGAGLDKRPSLPTRLCHLDKITEKGMDNSNKDSIECIVTERVDAICFTGTNGSENLLANPDDGDELDVTDYSHDASGNKVPPDNKDKNKYIAWPDGQHGVPLSKGPWIGPNTPVRQGPLWWIVKAHGAADDLAILCFNLGIGYFGQTVGEFRMFIENANFPIFSDTASYAKNEFGSPIATDGTIWHYPTINDPGAPVIAFPDNHAQSYPPSPPIPDSPGDNISHDLTDYEMWTLKPRRTAGFGYGGTNIVGLNLSKIRAAMGKSRTPPNPPPAPGFDDPNAIRFRIGMTGIPEISRIARFTYTFFKLSINAFVAKNMTAITPDTSALGNITGNYVAYFDPPFKFFGQPHNTFGFGGAGPIFPLGICPYITHDTFGQVQCQDTYNSLTNTGTLFQDGYVDVSINSENQISMSGGGFVSALYFGAAIWGTAFGQPPVV